MTTESLTKPPSPRDTPGVFWVHTARARTGWYGLDPSQRSTLQDRWSQVRSAAKSAGATTHGTFDVRGQSDYSVLEAWSFPDAEAAFTHWAALVDAGYAQWFAFANTLGTRADDPEIGPS